MEKLELMKIATGDIELEKKLESIIDDIQMMKNELNENEKALREQILNELIKNNITSIKVGKYKISQVIPKSIEEFDTEKFIKENQKDLVELFVTEEKTTQFDMDKLKEQYPEVYNDCLKEIKCNIIDIKNLKKHLPEIYNKYVTIKKPNKKITLMIK